MQKNSLYKYCFILLLLFIIPIVIFTHRLDKNPPGFFIDESISGFEAYLLINTKGYSSTGEFLPRLFLNPGEAVRNHYMYIYFLIPSILMFGLNEFAVRLTTVFFSIGLLFTIFLLVKYKVTLPSILFVAFWWPLSGWVFLLSRIGMEFISTGFFYLLGFYFLTKLYEEKYREKILEYVLILGVILFFLFYIYAAGKILSVGLMFIAMFILLKKRAQKQIILLTGILFALPLVFSVPYIMDYSFFYRVNELTQCNTHILFCFVKNIETHFSYGSYFANTYLPPDFPVPTHSIKDTSLIPRILFPFLLIGIGVLLQKARRKDFFSILLLVALFIGILPPSLTIRGFDSYRSVPILPLIYIAIIYGVDVIYKSIRKLPFYLYSALVIIFLGISLLSAKQEITHMLQYEYETTVASYGDGSMDIDKYLLILPDIIIITRNLL